jgi:hypothetical protein
LVLQPDFIQGAFGPSWGEQQICYGTNRAVTTEGPAIVNSQTPLRPLAKGSPVLLLSGVDWEDLRVPMYALEGRQRVHLSVDLQRAPIELVGPPSPDDRETFVTPEGHLAFR